MRVVGAHVVFHKLTRTREDNDAIQAVLLCKRTQDAPIHPGHWSLFGGKVKSGEMPEKAVRREVKEELEITGQPLRDMTLLCDVQIRRKKGTCAIRYFSSPLDVDMDGLRLKRSKNEKKVEGEGLGWFTAEEVHHLMMRPEDRIAVTELFRVTGA